MIWAATRRELVRLARPRMLLGWFGLVVVLAALFNVVMFSMSGAGAPAAGPGVTFPDAATLASPDGLVIGLTAASSMFGLVTLAFWAMVTATDCTSGLIRLLVAAQPRPWTLLVGKVIALTGVTAIATLLALVVDVGIAPAAASAVGRPGCPVRYSPLWRRAATTPSASGRRSGWVGSTWCSRSAPRPW